MGLVLLWILNLIISIFNAWGCGKAWNQTLNTVWARLLLWCGAIMSASGFTWCYLTLLLYLSQNFGWLPPAYNVLAAELGYVILIPIVITSGLVITVDSWVYFARNRNLGGGLTAAYNTYATYRNISDAVTFFPAALKDVTKLFDTKSNDDTKGKAALLAIVLVLVAFLGGILTTRYIILSTAQNTTQGLA